jgi:hypothetical protein
MTHKIISIVFIIAILWQGASLADAEDFSFLRPLAVGERIRTIEEQFAGVAPVEYLTEKSVHQAAISLGIGDIPVEIESSRGAWILAAMSPFLSKKGSKQVKIFELGGSNYSILRNYLKGYFNTALIWNIDIQKDPDARVLTIIADYRDYLLQLENKPDTAKANLIFSIGGASAIYTGEAAYARWKSISCALRSGGRAVLRPFDQADVFLKNPAAAADFVNFLAQFGIVVEKVCVIPYGGIRDRIILVLRKIPQGVPQPDLSESLAQCVLRPRAAQERGINVLDPAITSEDGLTSYELWGETDFAGEMPPEDAEMNEIIQSILRIGPPEIVEITDIRLWKKLQGVFGPEGDVLIGRVVDMVKVAAIQWMRANPGATPRDYWAVRTRYEWEVPVASRFKILVYKPFDNGVIGYHEKIHVAMGMRAIIDTKLYLSKGGTNILFESGTESADVRQLQKMADHYPDTKKAFGELVAALRNYLSADLSQELFTWIYSLVEYPDYIGKPFAGPGTEEAQYLERYLSQAGRTTTIMLEPARNFISASKRHPEIMAFLSGYYERLRRFSLAAHFPGLPACRGLTPTMNTRKPENILYGQI